MKLKKALSTWRNRRQTDATPQPFSGADMGYASGFPAHGAANSHLRIENFREFRQVDKAGRRLQLFAAIPLDLRKFHPNGRILELLTEEVIEHLVFDLIEGAAGLPGDLSETNPHEYGAGDVIAMDARFAALAALDPGQLFGFAMKLLDLPAQAARVLCGLRRSPE